MLKVTKSLFWQCADTFLLHLFGAINCCNFLSFCSQIPSRFVLCFVTRQLLLLVSFCKVHFIIFYWSLLLHMHLKWQCICEITTYYQWGSVEIHSDTTDGRYFLGILAQNCEWKQHCISNFLTFSCYLVKTNQVKTEHLWTFNINKCEAIRR